MFDFFLDFLPQRGEKSWKWHFLGEFHPFSRKWVEFGENRTFHPEIAFWAPAGSKTPKNLLVLTVSERGAPPGGILDPFGPFHQNGWKVVKSPRNWSFYLNLVILGLFRDFRDSGCSEMHALPGPAGLKDLIARILVYHILISGEGGGFWLRFSSSDSSFPTTT